MGQALAPLECFGNDYWDTHEERRETSASIYLSQFANEGGKVSEAGRNIKERYKEPVLLDIGGVAVAKEQPLVNPDTGDYFDTDMRSLLDVDGDGIECGEVIRAVCMTTTVGAESQVPGGEVVYEGRDFLHIDHSRTENEVLPVKAAAALVVPPEFQEIEYNWAAPSATQATPTAEQQDKLQSCLKPFIRSMLDGVLCQLHLDANEVKNAAAQDIAAVVCFNQDLELLLVTVGDAERTVPMRSLRQVRPEEKKEDGSIFFSLMPLEPETVVVLRVAGGRLLRFRFEGDEQAAYFGTCMRLMMKAQPKRNAGK